METAYPVSKMQIFRTLFEIVIGLALVGVVATSTNSGSTALAGFTTAQTLVILIPLIFVAIILYAAYTKIGHKTTAAYEFAIGLPIKISRLVAQGFAYLRISFVRR